MKKTTQPVQATTQPVQATNGGKSTLIAVFAAAPFLWLAVAGTGLAAFWWYNKKKTLATDAMGITQAEGVAMERTTASALFDSNGNFIADANTMTLKEEATLKAMNKWRPAVKRGEGPLKDLYINGVPREGAKIGVVNGVDTGNVGYLDTIKGIFR